MQNEYSISDEATTETIHAESIEAALDSYVDGYDTAEMGSGERFEVSVRDSEGSLVFTSGVTADGKGGILKYGVPA